ncbi:MAG: SPOR domain-containing protein [Pseudomonadota bacterium]
MAKWRYGNDDSGWLTRLLPDWELYLCGGRQMLHVTLTPHRQIALLAFVFLVTLGVRAAIEPPGRAVAAGPVADAAPEAAVAAVPSDAAPKETAAAPVVDAEREGRLVARSRVLDEREKELAARAERLARQERRLEGSDADRREAAKLRDAALAEARSAERARDRLQQRLAKAEAQIIRLRTERLTALGSQRGAVPSAGSIGVALATAPRPDDFATADVGEMLLIATSQAFAPTGAATAGLGPAVVERPSAVAALGDALPQPSSAPLPAAVAVGRPGSAAAPGVLVAALPQAPVPATAPAVPALPAGPARSEAAALIEAPTALRGAAYLQAGIFVATAYGQRLKDNLIAEGLEADILATRFRGEEAIRVRLGPFETAEARDTALETLRRLGINDAMPVAR